MRYVIVGNGPAGVEAALAVRKSDQTGVIDIITCSSSLYYYRPGLVEHLNGEGDLSKLVMFKQDFYEEKKITNILGRPVEGIGVSECMVYGSNGVKIVYDRLLIATGSSPFVPPIIGVENEGVFTLRTMRDAERIGSYVLGKKSVIVIGAGLLGLEIAYNLSRSVSRVTVIESEDRLLPRQLDCDGADVLEKCLLSLKIDILKKDRVREIKPGPGKLLSVYTEGGAGIECCAVVVCAGVKPDTSLAINSGIKAGKGIEVDRFFRTSSENIYAAGDAAEFDGRTFGYWSMSRRQGTLAGDNMTGASNDYKPERGNTVLKIAGIDVFSAGELDVEGSSSTVVNQGSVYKRLDVLDGKITGIAVIGDSDTARLSQKAFEKKIPLDDIVEYFEYKRVD